MDGPKTLSEHQSILKTQAGLSRSKIMLNWEPTSLQTVRHKSRFNVQGFHETCKNINEFRVLCNVYEFKYGYMRYQTLMDREFEKRITIPKKVSPR